MVIKKKLVKKKKRVRKPKQAALDVSGSDWQAVVFGDLHIKASTLAVCLGVLKRVRELAVQYGAEVICTGDFWDQRGVLSVRQVDAIQDELDEHQKLGIKWKLIPGNHDQVSRDGLIHGLRIFSKYPNIQVISEPVIDDESEIAYLPWREDPKEQKALFKDVPENYTIFGHGEVKGAVANNGHKADGRFTKTTVKDARAVYLGHYHKRHQVGNVWYLGSPYEQNMGERNMPHGVALVTSNRVEPQFVDFDEFPKHWRLTWPQDAELFRAPRKQDIVEVLAPKQELHGSKLSKALDLIQAVDVRPLPLSTSIAAGAPSFALRPEEAIDRWVDDYEELPEGLDPLELKAEGHRIFGEVSDKGVIVPLGNTVHILGVTVEGFCAIRDRTELPLDKLGTCLLRGPMGAGKTALASDALTWVLFGLTAPRKPGGTSASLKADAVINDASDTVFGEALIKIDDGDDVYSVTRTKVRNRGSKIDVTKNGKPWKNLGISDSQELVHHLVGMGYDLWRTCVALGQGEVQNFVTDAQKKRTELLERGFQLSACPFAQKSANKKRKAVEEDATPMRTKLIKVRASISEIEGIDYRSESEAWERDRQSKIDEATALINAAKVEIHTFDGHLKNESGWKDRAERLESQLTNLTDQLSKSDTTVKAGHLHSQIGSSKTERQIANTALDTMTNRYKAMQQPGAKVCPQCNQALPTGSIEEHLSEMEESIRLKKSELQTIDVRIQNLQHNLGEISMGAAPDLSGVKAQISETRAHIAEAQKAITAISQIRVKREALAQRWEDSRRTISSLQAQENLWEAKQRQQERKLAELKDVEATTVTALSSHERDIMVLSFWEHGFGPKGLPVLVLRTAMHELEMHANNFLGRILGGRVFTELEMLEDDLNIKFFEYNEAGEVKERDYLQLSGGQRRCVQIAFAPFALSEMIFTRTGVRIPFLVIDELTTHLDPDTKPIVCSVLRDLDRDTVLVIDHDPQVQGEFDVIYDVKRGGKIKRAA